LTVNRHDRPLRALQTLVQFNLARCGADVADAATHRARAQQDVSDSMERCETIATELRAATARSLINPALLAAMRKLYRVERQVLDDSRSRLAAAQQRELQARSRLADLRNRERSLDKALQAEQRKRQLKQQVRDIALADDMWLLQAWRELS
jgi:DNA topoisomerase IB